jgi:hypothetical protein
MRPTTVPVLSRYAEVLLEHKSVETTLSLYNFQASRGAENITGRKIAN